MKKYLTLLTLILASQIANAQGPFGGGDGTESNPYLIATKEHIEELADSVNRTPLIAPYNYTRYKYFNLMNNITNPPQKTIGLSVLVRCFDGVFDGNGYKITLDMQLFDYAGDSAVIKNLNVDGVVYKGVQAGGIVSYNEGLIYNCNSYVSVSTFSTGGGIAGNNRGRIIFCANYGTITGIQNIGGIAGANINHISNSTNQGEISADSIAGGIAGHINSANGYIGYCLNIGTVKSSGNRIGGIAGANTNPSRPTITNSINAGYVKGDNNIGGIVGADVQTQKAIIVNCININVVEGNGNVGAIVGTPNPNVTNCHYDKQFCNHKGVNGADVSGVYPHLTRNMVGRKLATLLGDNDWTYVEGATLIQSLYPQLKVLDHTDASKVGASPIYLYDGIKD